MGLFYVEGLLNFDWGSGSIYVEMWSRSLKYHDIKNQWLIFLNKKQKFYTFSMTNKDKLYQGH